MTTTPRPPDPREASIFNATVVSVSSGSVRVSAERHELSLTLANTGAPIACYSETHDVFSTRLATILPVGSAVTVVRAAPGVASDRKAFIHVGSASDTSIPPSGPSINEQLVTEGSAALSEARRDSTTTSHQDQIAAIRAQSQPVAVPYIDAIARADGAAWEGRLGAIGECRNRLDREEAEKREKWGPDGRAGTDDDPEKHYTSPPSAGTGGGGGRRVST
ncbi:hypothetical protein [Nocardia sp. NPDC060249]|uniref:hypothetical protein n=1 Tax=Nocardia sp. NPDC060249 TaxID=3347082 RepID=UPI003653186B